MIMKNAIYSLKLTSKTLTITSIISIFLIVIMIMGFYGVFYVEVNDQNKIFLEKLFYQKYLFEKNGVYYTTFFSFSIAYCFLGFFLVIFLLNIFLKVKLHLFYKELLKNENYYDDNICLKKLILFNYFFAFICSLIIYTNTKMILNGNGEFDWVIIKR